MLSIAMMGVCNETKIKDVFSMDEEGCVEDSLRHSVFAGIGVIGLLLLVLMVLVITVCCLACKLGRMKRKTRVAFFANSDLAQEATDVESTCNTLNAVVVVEEESTAATGPDASKLAKSASEGGEEQSRDPAPVPVATEQVNNNEVANEEEEDAYATVKEKGIVTGDCTVNTRTVNIAGREVSVSYDLIGEDPFLIGLGGNGVGKDNEDPEAHDDDEKYSQIASSAGVKILEGDHAKLQHVTNDTAPSVGVQFTEGDCSESHQEHSSVRPLSSGSATGDVSSLYSKVNKQKKVEGDDKQSNADESGRKEVSLSSPKPSVAEGAGTSNSTEALRSESTVESLDTIVTDMYKNLEEVSGPGKRISDGDTQKADEQKGAEEIAIGVDNDSFYVNIDL